MAARFSPLPLLKGHWRSLSSTLSDLSIRSDLGSRLILAVGPAALLCLSLAFHWTLKAPTALLSGTALLAGGLLSAFGQIASWRSDLRERLGDYDPSPEDVIRLDSVDETASHLLMAAYLAGLEALLIVVGLNVSADKIGNLTGVVAALCFGVGAYLALLFLLAVPRLYAAYADVNAVRKRLSGLHN